MQRNLTRERLLEVVTCNPDTGLFTWNAPGHRRRKSGQAGHASSRYMRLKIDGRLYTLHHLMWLSVHGYLPQQLDHINGNGHDNRIANLRECTQAENARNTRCHKDSATGYKGVSRQRDRYRACIRANGRKLSLGVYSTPEEAHRVYVAKATELFGQFANNGTEPLC